MQIKQNNQRRGKRKVNRKTRFYKSKAFEHVDNCENCCEDCSNCNTRDASEDTFEVLEIIDHVLNHLGDN